MNDTLKQIGEAWESVLLEMDSKLESYAQKLPEDGMATDFLELLMFGVPSPELESFLQVKNIFVIHVMIRKFNFFRTH
jgi:hypothetical protein